MNEEFITIGKVTKAHGVKGEVRVLPLTDFPERFENLKLVYLLQSEGSRKRMEVVDMRPHGNLFVVKFKGIDQASEAELLRGSMVQVEISERFPLPEGHYYIYEIIGCQVFTDSGERIGQVSDVVKLESNDIYLVEGDGREVLIPAIKDVVKRIDTETKRLVISPIEGLFLLG